MPALGVRSRIGIVLRATRRCSQRPTRIPAEVVEICRTGVNARESEKLGIGDSGVQAIIGRADVGIEWSNRLVETVIAEARGVDPTRVGSPSPINSHHLGNGGGARKPLWTKRHGILLDLIAIRINKTSGETVVLVRMVVALENQIVGTIRAIEIEVDNRWIEWIRRKPRVVREQWDQIQAELI